MRSTWNFWSAPLVLVLMQKCTDFPEASHYSVELSKEEKSVHQTDNTSSEHKVIVMLCLSPSLVFSHTPVPEFQFSPVLAILLWLELCSLIAQYNQHRLWVWFFTFLIIFLPPNNSRAISSPHQWCHGVTTSSRSPRGDLSLTQKHETTRLSRRVLEKKENKPSNKKD